MILRVTLVRCQLNYFEFQNVLPNSDKNSKFDGIDFLNFAADQVFPFLLWQNLNRLVLRVRPDVFKKYYKMQVFDLLNMLDLQKLSQLGLGEGGSE